MSVLVNISALIEVKHMVYLKV